MMIVRCRQTRYISAFVRLFRKYDDLTQELNINPELAKETNLINHQITNSLLKVPNVFTDMGT